MFVASHEHLYLCDVVSRLFINTNYKSKTMFVVFVIPSCSRDWGQNSLLFMWDGSHFSGALAAQWLQRMQHDLNISAFIPVMRPASHVSQPPLTPISLSFQIKNAGWIPKKPSLKKDKHRCTDLHFLYKYTVDNLLLHPHILIPTMTLNSTIWFYRTSR